MKFTLSWLKGNLETTASLADISRTLTAIGLEVESVTNPAESLAPFTVAKILHAEKHPEADKLRVCRVQSNAGELQIVCGAPNARAGIFVALAQEGATIPANGMVIKKTKIRGVESNGMLCSAAELGLSGESDGIIELPEDAVIGQPVADAMHLNDPLIDIAITPNRADCLSLRGVARDLAAAGLGTIKPLPPLAQPEPTGPNPIAIRIETPACPQFIGCTIEGVTNGESPAWLKQKLEAIGQKSISTLVDITNYLMLRSGRPMHAYDADKLTGAVTARSARDGERIKALNGKEYALTQGMTVIADDNGPLGLAGIIGGEACGCSATTTRIFLEIALFDPTSIAQTGRALDILSDARYRFERGVDPAAGPALAERAVALITHLCGGKHSAITSVGAPPAWERTIPLRHARVESFGGISLPKDRCQTILTALGFTLAATGEGWNVTPPSWRADIGGEADLIEEILRIHGYDNIPAITLPKPSLPGKPAATPAQKREHLARRILATRGMLECCTWSFLPHAQAKIFGGGAPEFTLLNPISADLDSMRPSLLPNLLEAARKNTARGLPDLALFEVGLQFHAVTPDGQRMVAAGIRSGQQGERQYADTLYGYKPRPLDAFDAKADALALLQTLGVAKCDIATNTPPWYHPGRSGALTLGKTLLGTFGELHPGLLADFDLTGPVACFELFLDAIPQPRAKSKARPPLRVSDFQSVTRDFAFIVEARVTAADITKAINQADKQLITGVSIFDVYTGKGVEPDHKSVALTVTLQAPDRTLSEAEITAVSNAIIASAAKGFGGRLRQ